MSTIHVSITLDVPDDDPTNGGDFAADLTAYVLTHYRGVTLIVTGDDLVSDDDFVAEATEILAAAAATDEPHPVVRTIGELERERLLATWSIPCPTCKADVGEQCHSPSGTNYSTSFVHNVRRRAWGLANRDQLGPIWTKASPTRTPPTA